MPTFALAMLFAVLAATGPEKLPVEKKRELIWLIMFVIAAGTTLLVIVMLLMRAWRRNVAMLQKERRQLATPPDIWKAGGDRLVAKMSPFPKSPADKNADIVGDDATDEGLEDDDDAFPPQPPDNPDDNDEDEDDDGDDAGPRRGDQR